MELYDAIQKRHSVRAYAETPVAEEKLNAVLEAAHLAPSANNKQDFKCIVVRDPELLAQLVQACGQPWMSSAPVIIAVVSTNPRTMFCKIPAGPVDCAIAIDHMTLAAAAEGLGTCWIGHFDQDACKSILNIPDDFQIIELLTLGVPDEDTAPEKKRKPLSEIVCFDVYSE